MAEAGFPSRGFNIDAMVQEGIDAMVQGGIRRRRRMESPPAAPRLEDARPGIPEAPEPLPLPLPGSLSSSPSL